MKIDFKSCALGIIIILLAALLFSQGNGRYQVTNPYIIVDTRTGVTKSLIKSNHSGMQYDIPFDKLEKGFDPFKK